MNIYYLDITKNRLDFGDIDFICKVTSVEKLKIYDEGTSVFSQNTINLIYDRLILSALNTN